MSVIVVNRLQLTVSVDALAPVVAEAFADVFRAQPGFEHFYLVKTAERAATVVIVWSDDEAASAGAAVIGPTLFQEHLVPVLVAPQDREVGPAVVEIGP